MKKERIIRIGLSLLAVMAVVLFRVATAYADGMIADFQVEGSEALSSLTNILFTIVSAGGDVYLGYGAYKWAESFDSDESREQSKGISVLIAGACLANLKTATDLFG